MTKAELINNVASAAKVAKRDAAIAIDTVFDSIAGRLKMGEKTTIVGFGTFSVKNVAARKGHNPLTGESIEIAAKKKVAFKVSKELKGLVL